jgi:hypothetical protein
MAIRVRDQLRFFSDLPAVLGGLSDTDSIALVGTSGADGEQSLAPEVRDVMVLYILTNKALVSKSCMYS